MPYSVYGVVFSLVDGNKTIFRRAVSRASAAAVSRAYRILHPDNLSFTNPELDNAIQRAALQVQVSGELIHVNCRIGVPNSFQYIVC